MKSRAESEADQSQDLRASVPRWRGLKALILDDCSITARIFSAQVSKTFPGIVVEHESEPIARPGFNIYLIDDLFGEKRHGLELVRLLRTHSPDGLMILCSGDITAETLRKSVNAGCDAVFDKKHPEEFAEILRVIRDYAELLDEQRLRTSAGTRLHLMFGNIRNIIRAWNERLDKS